MGDRREAIEHADRALALAAQLGLPESARALGFRGSSRADLGDPGGLEDLRRARDAAIAQGLGRELAVTYYNLALSAWPFQGPRQLLELARGAPATHPLGQLRPACPCNLAQYTTLRVQNRSGPVIACRRVAA